MKFKPGQKVICCMPKDSSWVYGGEYSPNKIRPQHGDECTVKQYSPLNPTTHIILFEFGDGHAYSENAFEPWVDSLSEVLEEVECNQVK